MRPSSAANSSRSLLSSSKKSHQHQQRDILQAEHAEAAARGEMHFLVFDLSTNPRGSTLEDECNRLERSLVDTVSIVAGGDSNKAFLQTRSKLAKYDYDDKGFLNFIDFQNACKLLNANPSSEKAARFWFSRYDSKNEHKFDYKKFCRCLFGRETLPAKDSQFSSVISSLRNSLIRAHGRFGIRVLALALFSDNNNNNNSQTGGGEEENILDRTMTKQQLQAAVNKCEIPFSFTAQELDHIFSVFNSAEIEEAQTLGANSAFLTSAALTSSSSSSASVERAESKIATIRQMKFADTMNKTHSIANKPINTLEFLTCVRISLNHRRRELIDLAFDQLLSAVVSVGAANSAESIEGGIPLSLLLHFFNGSVQEKSDFGRLWKQHMNAGSNASGDDEHSEKLGAVLVSRDSFVDYYKDISSGISSDDEFEATVRRTWCNSF